MKFIQLCAFTVIVVVVYCNNAFLQAKGPNAMGFRRHCTLTLGLLFSTNFNLET